MTARCWKLPQSGFWIIVFVSYGKNLKRNVRFLSVGEMLFKVKLWGRHSTVLKASCTSLLSSERV